MNAENISWSDYPQNNVANPVAVGVEPATSWEPVGHASNWATETSPCPLGSQPERVDIVLLFNESTVDSRYLEFQGTLWNTSRYP